MRPPIVFIHGLFQQSTMWIGWRRLFEDRGWVTHAPQFPGRAGPAAQLRQAPDPSLGSVTAAEVVGGLQSFIASLEAPPIIVGHSIGGLFTQVLVGRCPAAAAVLLGSGAPNGLITPDRAFLAANLPVINPLARHDLFTPSPEWFHRYYASTLSRPDADALYEATVVPDSRAVARTAGGADLRVDFDAAHPPLLFVSGDRDRLVPLSLNRRNAGRYRDRRSTVDQWVEPGRSHTLCVEPGWPDLAARVADWCDRQLGHAADRNSLIGGEDRARDASGL